jgi:hypothetical protein
MATPSSPVKSDKLLPQQLAAADKAVGQRVFRPSQVLCCLVVGFAFEMAEHDGHAVFVGQSADFFIKNRAQLLPGGLIERFGARHLSHLPFPFAAGRSLRSCPQSNALGHAVEPVRQRLAFTNGGCPSHKDDKRRLQCILGQMRVAQHAPADGQDHWAVALDQDREGCLLAAGHETPQQFRVRHTLGFLGRPGFAKVFQNFGRCGAWHGLVSPQRALPLYCRLAEIWAKDFELWVQFLQKDWSVRSCNPASVATHRSVENTPGHSRCSARTCATRRPAWRPAPPAAGLITCHLAPNKFPTVFSGYHVAEPTLAPYSCCPYIGSIWVSGKRKRGVK